MKIVHIMFTAFDKDEVAQKKITIGSVKKNKLWLTCFFLLFVCSLLLQLSAHLNHKLHLRKSVIYPKLEIQ